VHSAMSKPSLTVTSDFTKNFNEILKRFRKDEVLVGIPEVKATRTGDEEEKEPINNATLLAINEFGSPQNNIPPRPVMAIGIRLAQAPIADQFKLAAQNALSQGFKALDIYYNRVGLIASNSIKQVINNQTDIKGPSKSTLKGRKARGFKGTKALIVTGQMRNAITYVLRSDA
jgi:hypothetical protein